MDPFAEDAGDQADLSSFQAPVDASAFNGDFYEVDSSETQQAPMDYSAPQDEAPQAFDHQVYEQQAAYVPEPATYEPATYEPQTYTPEPLASGFPVVEEENELTKFMQKFESEIAAKAEEQEKVAVESKEKAKTDMEKFLAERSRIKESKQQSNRVAEQATLEKLAADLESENPWERVVSLVDLETNRKQKLAALNASNKKDGKNKTPEPEPKAAKKSEEEEDVSRMRQLFVQLKATPLEKTRTH